MKRLLLAAVILFSSTALAQEEEAKAPGEAAPDQAEVEAATGESAAPPEEPTTASPTLVGRATIQGVGGPGRRLTLYNDSDTLWTGVVVTLNQSITCRLASVQPQDHDGILLPKCTGDVLSNEQIHRVLIEATEGRLEIKDPPLATPPDEIKAWAQMTIGFGPFRRLKITNASPEDWTGCRVTINEHYTYDLDELTAGVVEGIMLGRFTDPQGVKYTANHQIKRVDVACDQGNARIRP
jgi:hypothetical protein